MYFYAHVHVCLNSRLFVLAYIYAHLLYAHMTLVMSISAASYQQRIEETSGQAMVSNGQLTQWSINGQHDQS